MKKLSLAILALLATKQIHAMNVESEIQCKYGNLMTLSFSGSQAIDPDSRYQLAVDGDKKVYEGAPDTEDYANIKASEFKFKGKEKYEAGFSKEEGGSLEKTRYYVLNLKFTQIPANASTLLKKTISGKRLKFNCIEKISNQYYE